MKLTRTIIILSSFLISCSADYMVTKKGIKFQWPKSDNFKISEIQVDSLGEKERPFGKTIVPIKYKRTKTIECLTLDNVSKINDSTAQHIQFKPRKKVYFYKENKYYKWCMLPIKDNSIQNILPLKFEANHWYEFSGFPENKVFGENYTIYVYINSKGKLKQFRVYLNPDYWKNL